MGVSSIKIIISSSIVYALNTVVTFRYMPHFAFIVIFLWIFKQENEQNWLKWFFPVFKFKFSRYLSSNRQRSKILKKKNHKPVFLRILNLSSVNCDFKFALNVKLT